MANDTIFSEVDEELRRDRMRKLWRQAGPFIIGAAVAVVIGVAGYEGFKWWQNSNSSRWSDEYYAAVLAADGTDTAAAETALAGVVTNTGGGYPVLAEFRQAALLAKAGKLDEALAAYDGLATRQTDTKLRELALIFAANLLVDKGDVAGVQQRVAGMLGPDSALRNSAQEVVGLAQYKAGDLQAAITTFQAIVEDPLASQQLRARIQIYVSQLIAEGATLPAAAVEDVPAEGETAVDEGTELDVTPPAESSAVSSSAEAAPSSAESAAASSSASAAN